MAILAGIDEAGLGPIVGPLVVAVSVFRVGEELLDGCLWRALGGAVARKGFRRSPALPIADSKTMHVRSDGVVHLERGLLGMLRTMSRAAAGEGAPEGADGLPRSLRGLLRRVAPDALNQMRRYPWYADGDLDLPRDADPADLCLRANAAARALAAAGASLEAVRGECVLEGDYNRLVAATRNKSVALMGVTSRLIAYVFNTHAAGQPARIVVDRQGGRMRYLATLQRIFPGGRIRILREDAAVSGYLVEADGRSAEISFHTDAESAHLPVALASMCCKYLRELFMTLLNRWWAARVEGLRPTAGYYVDGMRFLRDIRPALTQEGIDPALLVRSR